MGSLTLAPRQRVGQPAPFVSSSPPLRSSYRSRPRGSSSGRERGKGRAGAAPAPFVFPHWCCWPAACAPHRNSYAPQSLSYRVLDLPCLPSACALAIESIMCASLWVRLEPSSKVLCAIIIARAEVLAAAHPSLQNCMAAWRPHTYGSTAWYRTSVTSALQSCCALGCALVRLSMGASNLRVRSSVPSSSLGSRRGARCGAPFTSKLMWLISRIVAHHHACMVVVALISRIVVHHHACMVVVALLSS